jgi:hypothetical protein
MKSLRVVHAIARADFLERVRRYSYLITLLFAVYLGYAAGTGQISIRLGDYRGLYTSAWIGTLVSLVATTFVSLVGFYIVKNAVNHDRRTGVGEILAGTPLTRVTYLLGKFFSNFAVLGSMVLVLALSAVAMQLLAAEDRSFHTWALLSPFLLLALPGLAMTAATALLFETSRFLRGGFGNVLWFFLWGVGIAVPALTKLPRLDPSGLWLVYASMIPAARAGIPGYVGSFSFTLADKYVPVAPGFHWNGIGWTAELVVLRLIWLAIAFALVLCGVFFFDRFDPARSRRWTSAEPSPEGVAIQAETGASAALRPPLPALASLTPLASDVRHSGTLRLVAAELRLALKGYRWWWYAVAGGLLVAQFAAPLDISRGPLLASAWIWPIFVWSALGTREARFNTEQLLFSCPRILRRQFPAAWFAGFIVAALTGLGAAVRLAFAGQLAGLVAWAAGAVFIPSLALALGVWSGASKFFEATYTALWYVRPLKHIPGFDFTGSADGPQAFRFTLMYLVIAAILAAAAFLKRARQLRAT